MPGRAYRAYGLVFSSTIGFPDLSAPRSARPSIHLQLQPRRLLDAEGWSAEAARPGPDGKPWLFVSRREGQYRLRFEGADFVLRAGGRTIDVYRHAATPLGLLRHLALNQVLPLVLGHKGRTVLHASAFALDGSAVALIGPAGAGKSTLVASFAAHGRPMMSDDAVVLRWRRSIVRAVPAYGDVRVCPDTYAMLRGVRKPVPFCGRSLPLVALYVIAPPPPSGSGIRIDRLSRRDAVIELLKGSFVLDVTDRGRLVAQFERLTQDFPLSVHRIAYPRDFGALARVRDAIVADVRSVAAG